MTSDTQGLFPVGAKTGEFHVIVVPNASIVATSLAVAGVLIGMNATIATRMARDLRFTLSSDQEQPVKTSKFPLRKCRRKDR